MKARWVSDLIKRKDMEQWNTDEVIFISAGTGKGKTTFIIGGVEGIDSLSDYAKDNNCKILYLVNRDSLKRQIERNIDMTLIKVMTYQMLEIKINHRNYSDIEGYDYLVMDESHYFFNDSNFSDKTDLSLEWILSQENKIKIFITATSKLIQNYLRKEKNIKIKEYDLSTEYDYINLYFYKKDSTIKNIFNNLRDGEKGIYFANSIKKAYKMSKEIENAAFICSHHNKKYKRYMDYEERNKIETIEKFDSKILSTTMTLDNGINIDDEEVKHIAIDIFDIDILQQALGRKRMRENESKINVYIKDISNQQLGGRQSTIMKNITEANKLKDKGTDKYIDGKAKNNLGDMIDVYRDKEGNINLKINEMKYHKSKYDIENIKNMIEFGYIRVVSTRLGKKDDYKIIEKENKKESLEKYLDAIVGKRLYGKDNWDKLAELINLRDGRNNRLIKDLDTLSAHIKKLFVSQYILIGDTDWKRKTKDGSKNPKYGKKYWLILKDLSFAKQIV